MCENTLVLPRFYMFFFKGHNTSILLDNNTLCYYTSNRPLCQAIFTIFCNIFIGGKIKVRIDKFLKVSRILKRRTVAQEACDQEKVIINGKNAKPSKEVKPGDVVELKYSSGSLKFQVLEVKNTVKKDEASELYRIITD